MTWARDGSYLLGRLKTRRPEGFWAAYMLVLSNPVFAFHSVKSRNVEPFAMSGLGPKMKGLSVPVKKYSFPSQDTVPPGSPGQYQVKYRWVTNVFPVTLTSFQFLICTDLSSSEPMTK